MITHRYKDSIDYQMNKQQILQKNSKQKPHLRKHRGYHKYYN